jgi:hypothetical protein
VIDITPVYLNDAWISFKVKDMCANFSTANAELTVWRPDCSEPRLVCVEVPDPCSCGTKSVWKTVYDEPKKVTLTSSGVDCNGAAIFHLNQTFFLLGKGRIKGKLKACGEEIDVNMQIMTAKSVKGKTGKYNTTANYLVDGVVVGKVAILPDNCRIPDGYTPVYNGNVLAGYATTRPMNQFCKKHTVNCETIYLIK